MGGMHSLEWPLCTPRGYVRNIISIATSAYQGAWGISWGETQRQSIYADSSFRAGWYDPTPEGQPRRGLGVARMIGMLTYRSCDSFEARFGRKSAVPTKRPVISEALPTPPVSESGSTTSDLNEPRETTFGPQYSAQSYLQYQADKFLDRFDANCYLHLIGKMDTHDVTRGHVSDGDHNATPLAETLRQSLSAVPAGALIVGVQIDLLFPLQQQVTLAQCLSNATFHVLDSRDGHDGFLL